MECKCKYCSDKSMIKEAREIAENYNYSCFEHTKRAKEKWIRAESMYFRLNELTKGTNVNIGALLDLINELKK